MSLSSAFCIEQEALQRDRAGSASLSNVRDTASRAADAWRKEGVSAYGRERREMARVNRAKFAQAVVRPELPAEPRLVPSEAK